MIRRIPPWPILIAWLVFSILVYLVGSGFGGSYLAVFTPPPPTEYPIDFVLWLFTFCLVFAPVVLMPMRLLAGRRLRKENAPNH